MWLSVCIKLRTYSECTHWPVPLVPGWVIIFSDISLPYTHVPQANYFNCQTHYSNNKKKMWMYYNIASISSKMPQFYSKFLF